MFLKVRGTKVGVHGEGTFIVNLDNIKSIEVLRDTKLLYMVGDPYGITLNNSDYENLSGILDVRDCTC